jgi:hypothetical protein
VERQSVHRNPRTAGTESPDPAGVELGRERRGGLGDRSEGKWDCNGFADETDDFVRLRQNGALQWGYGGKHRKDLVDISASDVQWILKYLGRITDDQLKRGLAASGATPAETDGFARALRLRIQQLQRVAAPEDMGIPVKLTIRNSEKDSEPSVCAE